MAKPKLLNPTDFFSLRYLFVGTIQKETPNSITTDTVIVYNLSPSEAQILGCKGEIILSYGRGVCKSVKLTLIASKKFKDVYLNEIAQMLGSNNLKNAVLSLKQIKEIQRMHANKAEVTNGK